jgi:cobalamin biosynthetic protein CobC
MLDNFGAVWPGNLSPTPPDFDPARYLAACEVVLSRCKAAFPHLAFLPNGYNDWNPAGLRGESVLDDVSYLWAEGFRAKVGGTIYDAARLHERLRTFSWMDEDDDGLEAAARSYYGADSLLAVPGSQAAIQWLPRLLPPGRVALHEPMYNEHPAAWQAAGHVCVAWTASADYAVLCRPNNPTGRVLPRDELLQRARAVRWLVVDEAFIEAEAIESMIGAAENILVLRSLGKFFGLAGVRLGVLIGHPELLARLAAALGPWAVSHPARWAARLALTDAHWQSEQRLRLQTAAARLAALLRACDLGEASGTALFQYVPTERAAEFHDVLARRGILVRLFASPAALRIGLPRRAEDWHRLQAAFAALR